MLKLINIKKNDSFIEAEYIPEASKEVGYLKVDLKTRKISDSRLTSFDDTIAIYRGHAKLALLKLANSDTLPERYPVAWY